MNNKKYFLAVVFAVMFVSFLFVVSATATLLMPVAKGNYTTAMNASCISTLDNPGSARFWYSATGANTNALFLTIYNTSANQTSFNLTTANESITGLTDGLQYNWSCELFSAFFNVTANVSLIGNSTGVANVTIDNTAPTIEVYSGGTLIGYVNGTVKSTAVATNNLTLNISISDPTRGLNDSDARYCWINVNGQYNHSVPINSSGGTSGYCNTNNINLTGASDAANLTINIYINDSLNNMRLNSTLRITLDTTAPSPTSTCTSTSVSTGDAFPCTCSGSDATSGVNGSLDSSTSDSPDGTGTIANTGTFVHTCTITDNGGLSASTTTTYTVTQISTGASSSSSVSPGASGVVTATVVPSHTFSKVTPGVASIKQYTDPELGLKEIQINVNNEAQNVKVTVTKYDGKPAEVSVEKTGKVFQYMQIKVDNVAGKLNKATITTKVPKTWVSGNGLDKDKVSLFKYDENASKWNELSTTFNSEDDGYYYYASDVNSFSYFSIGEKTLVTSSGQEVGVTSPEATSPSSGTSTWVWVIVGVIVIAAIIGGGVVLRRKG